MCTTPKTFRVPWLTLLVTFLSATPRHIAAEAPIPIRLAADGQQSAKKFPSHWGQPPRIQTRDYRELPGGYGFGSSTLANWIQRNLDQDAKNARNASPLPAVSERGLQSVQITGELMQWHKVTLTADGPFARETD